MTFVKHFLIVIIILGGGIAVTGFIIGLFEAALPEYMDSNQKGMILIVGLIATVAYAVYYIVQAVRRPRSGAGSD